MYELRNALKRVQRPAAMELIGCLLQRSASPTTSISSAERSRLLDSWVLPAGCGPLNKP
jgi:hypothetical protein